MGGVCCKDGVDKQELGGGTVPGPAVPASAPTPASDKAAVEVSGATDPAKEPTQQADPQGSGKKEAPLTPSVTPASAPASAAVASTTVVNADQITLSERAQQAPLGDDSIEVPQTSAVRVGDKNAAANTSPAPAPAARRLAPTAATPPAAEPAMPETPVEPVARATPQLKPQPRPAAGEGMTQPPAQQQQPLPPFKSQALADLVQASEPSPRTTAPNLEVRGSVATSASPHQPPTSLTEAGLSIARDPSTTDQTAAPPDSKVRVETTRRSTHPPIAGGGAGGEASSSVSYSHSATSSQPPGSSAPQGSSHNPQDGGGSVMMGSSAAQARSAAGETAAPKTTGGNSLAGAESIEGSSNAVSDPSGTGSTPATNKTANSGFMFGAPRAREHKDKRRRDPKRTKSQSSGSNASGVPPPAGSEGITGSKASGSDVPGAAGSGNRGAVSGSQAATMIGSSAADPSVGSMDMMAASTSALGVGNVGSSSFGLAPGSPVGGSIGQRDYTTIGRRINRPAAPRKPAASGSAVAPSGGGCSSARASSKTRSDPSSVASSSAAGVAAAGVAAAAAGLGLVAEGEDGAAAGAGGVPEAVPEGEVEGEGEEEEGEEEGEGEEEEGDVSGASRRSSSEHLSIMSPPEGSDVENVLMLICNIFQLPVALVAAYRSANIFIRSTALRLTDDDQWRYSLAQWSMLNAYELRDVLMVPNAALDDRFRNHYCVKNEPKVKFFMASPLRSSTGELLGTLCMADFNERSLEPTNLLVVNNLQTLVIRQLERDMALAAERAENEAATEQLQQEMMRALDHFEKCIMFVDTSKPGWEVLYTNLAWEHVTGVPRVHVQGRPLQDFFMALGGAALDWSSTAEEVASRAEFTVHRVAVRQKPDKLVSLHLRLATDQASGELEGLLPKGLPGWVKARGNEAHNYFVFVEEVNPQQAPGSSTVYEALAKHVEKVPGLELSHLLGKGGFGSVYYGTWNAMPVAVKMIDNRLTKTNTEGISLEALMGQELAHPNIVKTIKYVMRNALNASSMSGSNSRSRGGISSSKPPLHSRNGPYSGGVITSRHGSRGLMLPAVGSSGANAGVGGGGANGHGANGHGGGGNGGGPATGMMSYMTSAQPGLSGMTSAQMAAALDLTSASAMQHLNRAGTTMTSDATTVAGGGSQYSGNPFGAVGNAAADGSSGVPPREANVAAVAAAAAAAAAAQASAGPGTATTSTTSGQTAVGPASIPASSASTAAGPPSIASAGGFPANNLPSVASPALSSRAPSITAGLEPLPSRRGSGPLTLAGGAAGAGFDSRGRPRTPRTPLAAPAVALPSQMSPLAAPAAAAASITAAYPPDASPPNLSHLTPGQQQAAMTSRFSLAFSTITSGGEGMVPGKGSHSPSSSSGGAHTQQMGGPMGSAGSGEDMGEVWIIMEFCDRGSLQDALDRGALKLRKPGGEVGETHLPMMVATACEVASALHYLHEKGIVHGDLTAWNVMLCTSPGGNPDRSGRNFVAKVADFGLSRTLDVKSKIKTRTYGTISHMPPECLISGIISKATDVFAFGVLLWQMYTGLRPWAGMNHGQIIYNVGMKNVQLLFPPGTPPAIADLSSSCTRTDPNHRPSFQEILDKLDNIRASLGL
ncbi:hypothetical protein PLESTB_001041000 [Pleodorina starrii]|uniref:Protein kinase domain-containing protein n=1 Tax=Pleodorina starrii TaxID=330485 RepID=A0A9W6BQ96_9CHLO|nr:hypothetical protein PLESTB_001041000 [Pleodorina starrii]